MKQSCISICSLCLVIAFAGSSASGALSIVNLSGDDVVFDDVSGLYWYQDLGDFADMTYNEQAAAIGDLNLPAPHAGLTPWRMANRADMEGLYLNGASAISASFLTSEAGEWLGRYDEESPSGEYYLGGVKDVVGLIPLGLHTEDDECEHTWLGAWAVASPNTPPAVPAPGAIALLMMGLSSMTLSRRRRLLEGC